MIVLRRVLTSLRWRMPTEADTLLADLLRSLADDPTAGPWAEWADRMIEAHDAPPDNDASRECAAPGRA